MFGLREAIERGLRTKAQGFKFPLDLTSPCTRADNMWVMTTFPAVQLHICPNCMFSAIVYRTSLRNKVDTGGRGKLVE